MSNYYGRLCSRTGDTGVSKAGKCSFVSGADVPLDRGGMGKGRRRGGVETINMMYNII